MKFLYYPPIKERMIAKFVSNGTFYIKVNYPPFKNGCEIQVRTLQLMGGFFTILHCKKKVIAVVKWTE